MLPLNLLASILFVSIPYVAADAASTDASRLGQFYTSLPLYRTGQGTNVFTVGVGTPAVNVNLTVSTNVQFVMVATTDCDGCTKNADEYSTDSSSLDNTNQALDYTITYPTGSLDTLSFTGLFAQDQLADARGDTNNAQPLVLLDSVQSGTDASGSRGADTSLSTGTSGFWGLGVYQANKAMSIIPAMLSRLNSGAPNDATSFTVGFDIAPFSTTTDVQAGTIDWGGAPATAYTGNFNWLNVNTTVAGSWGIPISRMRVGSTVVDTAGSFGSLDPGFDAIYVPSRFAESLFGAVSGASRDAADHTRWNVPCDTNISMTVTIASHEYTVPSSQLVQPRDVAGRTCWSSLVSWQNGSVPERNGEIRLGTPFLSGVYAVLYYSDAEQLVGIAGKPGSPNDGNVNTGGNGHPNRKLAGILIGVLGFILLLLLLGCYARNRSSFQSIWYRSVRRQHRLQTNAMIRGATIPPTVPLMGVPPPMMGVPPPMMGVPPQMMGYGRPTMMPVGVPVMGMGSHWMGGPAPAYQPPMQMPAPPPQDGMQSQQRGNMPGVVEANPRGHYSPRSQGYVKSPRSGKRSSEQYYSPRREQEFQQVPQSSKHASWPIRSDRYHPNQNPNPPNIATLLDQDHSRRKPPQASHPIPPAYTQTKSPDTSQSQNPNLPPPTHPSRHAQHRPHQTPKPPPNPSPAGDQQYDDWLRQYSGPGQNQQPYPSQQKKGKKGARNSRAVSGEVGAGVGGGGYDSLPQGEGGESGGRRGKGRWSWISGSVSAGGNGEEGKKRWSGVGLGGKKKSVIGDEGGDGGWGWGRKIERERERERQTRADHSSTYA